MKTLKTMEAVSAYNLLKAAKINKVSVDADKFNIIKTTRALKKVAEDFESFRADSVEALKAENHDDFVAKAQKWQQEEAAKTEVTLSIEERTELNAYFNKYNGDVVKCLEEEAAKENAIEVRTISEDSFRQLISGNDWTVEQILVLEEVLCD